MRYQVTKVATQPAAGAEILFVPAQGDWTALLAVTATLAVSSTAGNRQAALEVFDDTGNLLDASRELAFPAVSSSPIYIWDRATATARADSANIFRSIPLPRLWLPPGASVKTSTANLASNDQWSKIVFTFLVGDEWHKLVAQELIEQLAGAVY